MDLLQVAAHEFGHVLGLQHSLEPGAVMSPFYSDSYPPQLSEDDKMGIQYLYGPPLSVPPQMTDTNEIDIGIVRYLLDGCSCIIRCCDTVQMSSSVCICVLARCLQNKL